jgi:hypothetical protein
MGHINGELKLYKSTTCESAAASRATQSSLKACAGSSIRSVGEHQAFIDKVAQQLNRRVTYQEHKAHPH